MYDFNVSAFDYFHPYTSKFIVYLPAKCEIFEMLFLVCCTYGFSQCWAEL